MDSMRGYTLAILSRNAGYWRLSISPLRYIGVVANVSIMEMDIQIVSYDLPIGQRYSEATQVCEG